MYCKPNNFMPLEQTELLERIFLILSIGASFLSDFYPVLSVKGAKPAFFILSYRFSF